MLSKAELYIELDPPPALEKEHYHRATSLTLEAESSQTPEQLAAEMLKALKIVEAEIAARQGTTKKGE